MPRAEQSGEESIIVTRQELDALRRDALRYRWIKTQPEIYERAISYTGLDSIDDAIDMVLQMRH